MEFDAVLLAPRRAESVARGYWLDRTINDDLDACVASCPDKLALTAVQRESGEIRRFTYRELATLADRIAVGLRKARRRPQRRRRDAAAELVAVLPALSRLLAHRRGPQSADADLPRARAVLHAQARRSESLRRAQESSAISTTRRWRAACRRTCRRSSGSSSSEAAGDDDFDALLTTPEWEKAPDARDDPDARPARPRRHHPTHLHLRHDGRAQGRDAFGQHGDGQHRPLRRAAAARRGRHRTDGLADGPPDRLHVRADDADHAEGAASCCSTSGTRPRRRESDPRPSRRLSPWPRRRS